MEIKQRSAPQRQLWAQFDALQMGSGWDEEDIQKPQILLEDVFGDSHPGSTHLGGIMEQAKYGVFEKGGYPAQYHTTDICDGCAQGHDGMNVVLASREAIANMVEVHASAVPWDGIILSSSCDKSIPAHLKAAARMDVPTIFMPGGSMRPGPNMTTSLVAGDISLRQKRKDAITEQEVRDYKLTGCPSVGACTFLGTASTMQCMAEALGLTLPGAALVPATMRDILQYSRYAGRKIMELVEKNITPSQIMTPAAFRNAIIVHSAIGGSTNATIHLPSIARELGYDLPIELFDEINHQVPHLGNINPSGQHLTESFWFAGGVPMVELYLKDMLHLDVMTVTGKTLGENLPGRPPVMCAGCPHRGLFTVLSRLKLTVFGDIGCYTLGATPPLNALDTTLCMGASFNMLHGYATVRPEQAKNAVAVLGFRSADRAMLSEDFQKSCKEIFLCSDDGSIGRHGFVDAQVRDILEKDKDFTVVLACGPKPMLKNVAAVAAEFGVPCQVSMEERMACGVGACLGCATPMADGTMKHVCKDGPVFDAKEVDWNV